MTKTKKVGISGKFGVKYGRRIKETWKKIEEKQKMTYPCPSCGKVAVRRVAAGIWECKKCGVRFSGGAYEPKPTEEAKVIK